MSALVRELDTPLARSRRALLGAVGSGLTLAASGLLLPDRLAAAPEEVGLPARDEPLAQQARRRRHRRRRQRHKRDAPAFVTAVLSGTQDIPSNAPATIGFGIVLKFRNFSFEGNVTRFVVGLSGQYAIDLFLSLSSSSAGVWTTRLVVARPGFPPDVYDNNSVLTTEPTPTVFSGILSLEGGDTLEVVGLQNSATQALVSSGTIVITRQG